MFLLFFLRTFYVFYFDFKVQKVHSLVQKRGSPLTCWHTFSARNSRLYMDVPRTFYMEGRSLLEHGRSNLAIFPAYDRSVHDQSHSC